MARRMSCRVSGASPMSSDNKQAVAAFQLSPRLQKCWEKDIDWTLIPKTLREGCQQAAKSISMPATAVLAGLLFIISFSMSHSVVKVEGTEWAEPVLVWLAICMPTGCGKSSLCKYLRKLVSQAKSDCQQKNADWMLDDQSFEKLGELMQANHGKLLGLYDELPMFLSQINVCRGRTLADSQQVAIFLQLYGGDQWMRRTVSGEANFSMDRTGLTVGGFVQPGVAKGLIEYPPNIEKGLCQRFLWIVPKPNPTLFKDLNSIEEEFSTKIVDLMAALWKPNKDVQEWTLRKSCKVFEEKYDEVTKQIMDISSMDDLLSGMLSKSKGQILRVAATFHVLFNWETPHSIPAEITDEALKAAIDFVEICTQHAAFLAGRDGIQEAIDNIKEMVTAQPSTADKESSVLASARLSLTLPGQILNMSALCTQKKFRYTGNKAGALKGWQMLEESGIGSIVEMRAARGTDKLYEFHKKEIPTTKSDKEELVKELMKFRVSFQQYQAAYLLDNVTMKSIQASKGGGSPTKRKKLMKSSPLRKKLRYDDEESEQEPEETD